jgi:hypothetical protein
MAIQVRDFSLVDLHCLPTNISHFSRCLHANTKRRGQKSVKNSPAFYFQTSNKTGRIPSSIFLTLNSVDLLYFKINFLVQASLYCWATILKCIAFSNDSFFWSLHALVEIYGGPACKG